MAMPEPDPEPAPLVRAFERARSDVGGGHGQAHSKAVLQRVFVLARSFEKPSWFDAGVAPCDVAITEYVQMVAMSEASNADAEAYVTTFHAQHADHPYPAALIGPRPWTGNCTGRWP